MFRRNFQLLLILSMAIGSFAYSMEEVVKRSGSGIQYLLVNKNTDPNIVSRGILLSQKDASYSKTLRILIEEVAGDDDYFELLDARGNDSKIAIIEEPFSQEVLTIIAQSLCFISKKLQDDDENYDTCAQSLSYYLTSKIVYADSLYELIGAIHFFDSPILNQALTIACGETFGQLVYRVKDTLKMQQYSNETKKPGDRSYGALGRLVSIESDYSPQVTKLFWNAIGLISKALRRGCGRDALRAIFSDCIVPSLGDNYCHVGEFIAITDFMQSPLLMSVVAQFCCEKGFKVDLNQFPQSFIYAYLRALYLNNGEKGEFCNALVSQQFAEDLSSDNIDFNKFFSYTIINGKRIKHWYENFYQEKIKQLRNAVLSVASLEQEGYINLRIESIEGVCVEDINYLNKLPESTQKIIVDQVVADMEDQRIISGSIDILYETNSAELRNFYTRCLKGYLQQKNADQLKQLFQDIKTDKFCKMIMRLIYCEKNQTNIDCFNATKVVKQVSSDKSKINLKSCFSFEDKDVTRHLYTLIVVLSGYYNLNYKSLSLEDCSLGELPEEIFSLRYIENLNLKGNWFDIVPRQIGNLTELAHLVISDNEELGELPKEIGCLAKLRSLCIEGNLRLRFPDWICNLSELETLDISWCDSFENFPQGFGQLTKLKQLNISHTDLYNHLEGVICNLTSLEVLKVNECYVQEIPNSISNLRNLRELHITENNLESLPEVMLQLPHLETVDIRNNEICEFNEMAISQALKTKLGEGLLHD